MAELRKGRGFRVRCPHDDGTTGHTAIDLQGAVDIDTLARLAKTFKRCACGAELLMHDARRTFATEMSRRPGVSVRDVQRLLGHADLETTQRYLGRYRSDEARAAVDMGLASVLARSTPAEVVSIGRRRASK